MSYASLPEPRNIIFQDFFRTKLPFSRTKYQGSVFNVRNLFLMRHWFELSETVKKHNGSFGCHVCDKNAFIYIVRSLIFNNIAGNETKQFAAFTFKLCDSSSALYAYI